MTRGQAVDWLQVLTYRYEYDPDAGWGCQWSATISGPRYQAKKTIFARNRKSLDKKAMKLTDKQREKARLYLDRYGKDSILSS